MCNCDNDLFFSQTIDELCWLLGKHEDDDCTTVTVTDEVTAPGTVVMDGRECVWVLVEGYQDNDRPVWVSHHGDVIAEWETFFRPGSQLQPVTVMWPCF